MRRVIVFATAEAAEEAFYDAMQRGDLAAMMALWAEDEDVTCVHPSGVRLVGLPAVRMSFEELFVSGRGGLDIRPAEVRSHQGAVIAVHSVIEKRVARGPAGSRVAVCTATNVYVKQANGWRIVLRQCTPWSGAGPSSNEPVVKVLH